MIEFVGVTKSYKVGSSQKVILDNVTEKFDSDKNLGLVGINGAGKSTMVRILAGVEQINKGKVIRNLRFSWPLGFAGGFNASLTGAENLRFVSRIYGEDPIRVKKFVEEFSELGDFFYEPIKTYSSGMRARLAFGLSMAIDFECYLIDEILSVGDKSFQAKAQNTLTERRNRSKIVLVSHSFVRVKKMCDEVVVLNNGGLVRFPNVPDAEVYYNELLGV